MRWNLRRAPRAILRAACVALLLVGVSGQVWVAQGVPPPARAMAVAALTRLEADFYAPRLGVYAITGDKYGPTASLWPTSQALNGTIQVAALTHAGADLARVRRVIASLARYRAPDGAYHTRVFPSREHTDDNNWIALDLLDAYALLHDPSYLARAESLFHYLITQWDPSCGGLIWDRTERQRPTVSTAPLITIGMRLAMLTGQATYADWAMRAYAWMNTHLRRPDGLYWDHIRANGTMDTTLRSYNQGVMIAANLAIAAQTGDHAYLGAAERIAATAATALAGHLENHGHYATFDALYFQALGRLAATGAAPGLVALDPYLAWAWPTAGAPRARRTEEDLLEQAAFVIAAATRAEHAKE